MSGPRFLQPELPPYASITIVRDVTHAAPIDQRLIGGELLTECELWVKPWSISPDPTCPDCRAKLAETAEDVFGAATTSPAVKSPQTWDAGDLDSDDLFRYAAKLTRQERLQGLADRGIDTYRDRDEEN